MNCSCDHPEGVSPRPCKKIRAPFLLEEPPEVVERAAAARFMVQDNNEIQTKSRLIIVVLIDSDGGFKELRDGDIRRKGA